MSNQMVITLPRLHESQLTVKRERRRFNVLCNGRRWGKNILLQDLAIEGALAQRMPVAWAAPIYSDMIDDWRAFENLLAPVILRKNASDHRMDLVGGGSIKFWSLENFDAIRGKKYSRFIVNEAALVARLMDAWNFVIRPTLADYIGDAYFSGTPKGHNGFWMLFNQRGAEWMRWQMASYNNPYIPSSELDAMREAMPERAFQQEIMAQFIEDGGGIFRGVQKSAIVQPITEGEPGHTYVIGADWGRTEDATVYCVIDVDTAALVRIDRMTRSDFETQRIRLQALSERFHAAPCLVESNSIGQAQLEALQRMDVPVRGFLTTNASKAQIIDNLSLAFERGTLTIPDEPVLIAELLAYQSERLASGLVRYGAPEGAHDDCVIALALAWWACSSRQRQWLFI